MTDLAPTEQVAMLALAYRELWRAGHTDAEGMLEDLENCPGEVSLLGLFASDAFTEVDWGILKCMENPKVLRSLGRELAPIDPTRVEALLHAWPPDDPRPRRPWTEPFQARWHAVEVVMDGFSAVGLDRSKDDLEIAAGVMAADE